MYFLLHLEGFPGGSDGKKNLPAMQETWVWSLGWDDPLEKGKATYSSILAWRIARTVYSWGHKESNTNEQLSLFPYNTLPGRTKL